jgi:hypothetical protein
MRHSRKARDRGVLAEYAAGSGTQREEMQRRWNASVFMKRGTNHRYQLLKMEVKKNIKGVRRAFAVTVTQTYSP